MLVCSMPYKSYFTLSLSLLCNYGVSTWKPRASIAAGWQQRAIRQARNCMHELIASKLLHVFIYLFYYLVRLHATWPHKRNWQGGELSLNINRMSQGLSARTVMAISCFAFPNTLCAGNQSGVIPDLSQQLSRGEPVSRTIIRTVYYSKITGALKSRDRNRGTKRGRNKTGAFVVRRKEGKKEMGARRGELKPQTD